MKPQDLYHTGIVVEDVDGTLQWLTKVAGYKWCDKFVLEQVVETRDGELTVPLEFTYSMNEPRLEILARVPGTVWEPTDSGVHHLGYWSDDVNADISTLTASGLQVEVKQPLPDGSSLWAYCKGPTGPRIELVSRSIEPMMTKWFTTGRSPLAR